LLRAEAWRWLLPSPRLQEPLALASARRPFTISERSRQKTWSFSLWRGIVVWVRVHNREMEERAQEVLAESGGESIRVHEIKIEKRLDDLPLSKFNPDPWLGNEPPARH
jgi:hypothetical protein